MGQVDIQKLQQIVEALTKRVTQLEDYVKSVQRTLAAKGIDVPTL